VSVSGPDRRHGHPVRQRRRYGNADTRASGGDGNGGSTTALVNLTSARRISEYGRCHRAHVVSIFRQDSAIADANLPAVAQFGGAAPATYAIRVRRWSGHRQHAANVAQCVTLTANGTLTDWRGIESGFTQCLWIVHCREQRRRDDLGRADLNNNVTLGADTTLTGTTPTFTGGVTGARMI